MKYFKPKFWDYKNKSLSIILRPISYLFYCLTILRKNLTSPNEFKIPIICVGNIYLGGTGKTPVCIEIANELKNRGKNPVIVKKYYKTHEDEHKLIKNKLGSLIINKNRTIAIRSAEKKDFNIVILDDGFQDHKIKKDLSIICFNSKQLIGNGLLLPVGPLRESLSSIKRSKIIIINGKKNKEFEDNIFKISKNIQIYYSEYLLKDISKFKDKNIFAFAGIGNPSNFFDLLTKYNLNVCKTRSFPDHYKFKKKEVDDMVKEADEKDLQLVTTEKDFYRIKDFGYNKIEYLEINLVIEKKNKLIDNIISNI